MMHFTTVALVMTSLFVVARAFRSCGSPPCLCFRTGQVACKRLGQGLQDIPVFTRRQVENMTSLNLAGNDIREVRVGDFNPRHWRSLQTVDLRQNPNLNCESLNNIQLRVEILTECELLEGPPMEMDEEPSVRDLQGHVRVRGQKADMMRHFYDLAGPAQLRDELMSSRNQLDAGGQRRFNVRFEGTIEILD